MAQTPHRLQPDTPLPDNLAYINDNFDKAVSDINDLGAKFSSVGSASFTLATGGLQTITVDVSDVHPQYQANKMQIVPRMEMFVDVNDDDHIFPYGGSLTLAQQQAVVSVYPQRRARTGFVAMFTVLVYNFDVSGAHTYYINVDESYFYSPQGGVFR
jgi:hypothetical protein